jgi:hypothetical protein
VANGCEVDIAYLLATICSCVNRFLLASSGSFKFAAKELLLKSIATNKQQNTK